MRVADKVLETTQTTGTSDYTLDGASTDWRSFSGAGLTSTLYFAQRDDDASIWESGYGTRSGSTLSRDTIFANHLGTTAKVSWLAGTKRIFCAPIAEVYDSLMRSNAGDTRPVWMEEGLWIDTTSETATVLYYYDGADDIEIGTINTSTDAFTPAGVVTPDTTIAGEIRMYGGATAPTGWLLCDGTAVSRTTYATLFTAISTTFGTGDGSTTFNVPDLRGRSPIGAGTGSGLTARTLGGTGGEETHLLTTTESAAHSHTGSSTSSDGAHTHTQTGIHTGSGTTTGGLAGDASYSTTVGSTSSDGAHTHTLTIASEGGGGAHNNMQPYAIVNFIIATGA